MRPLNLFRSRLAAAVGLVILSFSAVQAAGGGLRTLARAYNQTGQDLFARVAQAPGNVVLSPYSVGIAMAMACSSARGRTESEMAQALHHLMTRTELDRANAELMGRLRGHETRAAAVDAHLRKAHGESSKPPSPRLELAVANALLITRAGARQGAFDSAYVDVLRRSYGAEIFRDASLRDVNAWAARKTAGRIKSVLGELDPHTRAVLVNAVLFRGAWQRRFARGGTRQVPFHLAGGGTTEVPMMATTGEFALATRPGYRAIRLPFESAPISMVVLVPDADLPPGQLPALSASELADLFSNLDASVTQLTLHLPRFQAGSDSQLVEAFKAAGMELAFDPNKADFSGMTGRRLEPPLFIGKIVHKARIEVDEDGALAAAVTVLDLPRKSASPPSTTTFLVDRPFLFFIVDHGSEAILFQGRISDPGFPP